ncbi:hypothetical protein COY95_04695 [Candidatus Woesearchaeota archaeon CG_4_10_14_0_8_um_filter_47_5]|nr:MAG: hypothetical protein COY95_04695 [Candidatus Woesearchaeota archaeon CG_4_10_14_0_8_um_filter_47_5]
MKRRVIKQGHNTLTITLPHRWVKVNNIGPKDEVNVLQKGLDLIISPQMHHDLPGRTIRVDARDMSIPLIWRSVSSAYRAGFTQIDVSFDTSPQSKDIYSAFSYNTLRYLFDGKKSKLSPLEGIQALVNRLVGVEIVDNTEQNCTIKELAQPSQKEFEVTLRRIFMLLLTMAAECREAMEGNKEKLKAIHIIDTNLDRFEDFCLRVLNKKGIIENPHKSHTLYTIVFLLEMLGDEIKKFSIHLLEEETISPEMTAVFGRIQKQLERFHKIFYKHDRETTLKIYAEEMKIRKLMKQTISPRTEAEVEFFYHMKTILRLVRSLTELTIDLHVDNGEEEENGF